MSLILEKELLKIIKNDDWMLSILKIVRDVALKDSWIGAGFVRNKIWDEKHKKTRSTLNDIDVIYFDKHNTTKEKDVQIEDQLKKMHSNLNWSVKNQARMHLRNNHTSYIDSNNAISFWPETATSIAVRLNLKNGIEYIAPHGLEDLFNLIVRPTPAFNLKVYKDRIEKKQWHQKWQKLQILTDYYK